jgi:Nitrate/nitrite transporter
MSSKKNMYKMMAVFAISYFSFTASYVLMLPFLEKIGYNSSEQGVIMAIGSLLGLFGQMIFGYLCDKYRSVKKFAYISIILLGIFVWIFYIITSYQFWLHLAIGGFMQSFFMIGCGILDSWALEADDYCKDNYGSIRAFGAIGWILGGPVIAWVASQFGYSYLGLAFLIITVVNFAISYTAPDAQKDEITTKEKIQISDVKVLLNNKRYLVLLIIFFLTFFTLQAEAFLSIQKIIALAGEGNETYVSLKSSFQAIFELPFFFLGGYLIKKFGSVKLLLVALVFYLVRIGGDIWASAPMQLVYLSCLQMMTFPFITITSKALIDEEIPLKLRSTGQQFAVSIYSCGSAFVAPLICGLLVGQFGIDNALQSGTVCTVLAIGFVFMYTKLPKKVVE